MIDDLLAGAVVGKVFSDGTDSLRRFLRLPPSQRLYRLLWEDFGTVADMSRDEFYALGTASDLDGAVEDLISGRRLANQETSEFIAARLEVRLRRVPDESRRQVANEMAAVLLRGYPVATRDLVQQLTNVTTKLDTQYEATNASLALLQSGVDRLLHGEGQQADLAAALVSGPLRHARMEEVAERARKLAAEARHEDAARAFVEVAQGLDAVGLITVAETYRLLAARQFHKAGDVATALDLTEAGIWQQLERGAEGARVVAAAYDEMSGGGWLSEALSACANWPQQPWAQNKLRTAAQNDHDLARRLRWLTTLTSIDLIYGQFSDLLQDIPDDLPELASGARLTIELDRLDALEETSGAEAADAVWAEIESWVATQPDAPLLALCWQRRGYVLARRGDLAGMRLAYRRGMAAWSSAPGRGEQVADCLFSMQLAESLLGVWNIDIELRPLASALESSDAAQAGQARRLQDRAASNRVAEKFPEAHRDYILAATTYRQTGSLSGALQAEGQLAELYSATGHLREALEAFVSAGDGKAASAIARRLAPQDISSVVRPSTARWERIAAYNVLEAVGTEADAELVGELADQLLADAAVEPASLIGSELTDAAKRALAGVVLQLPDARMDAGLEQVRIDLQSDLLISASQAAAQSLIRATEIGQLDAREDLVESFLAGHPIPRVNPTEIATLVGDRVDLRDRIIDAAKGGSMEAAQVALWASVEAEPWMDLQPVAEELARRASLLHTRSTETTDGQAAVTHNFGVNFAPGGLAARLATTDTRAAFFEHTLCIVGSDDEMEGSRISAGNGLFNCASALTSEQREKAWRALRPISLGEYTSTTFGTANPDPLSNFRMRTNEAGMLQAVALQTLGQLWSAGVSASLDDLREPTQRALSHPDERARAAGVEVMRRVPELLDVERLQLMLEREEPEVRREALLALGGNVPDRIRPHLVTLAADPHRPIRWAAINVAVEIADTGILEQIATGDLDSYTRGLAKRELDVVKGKIR